MAGCANRDDYLDPTAVAIVSAFELGAALTESHLVGFREEVYRGGV